MSAQSTDGFQAFPVPVGAIFTYAGQVTNGSLPLEYLVCDGTSYLKTLYPELFSVIGTTFGSADGTHFNVPDMRGVAPKASTTLGVKQATSEIVSPVFAPLTLSSYNLPSITGMPLSANLSGTMDTGSSTSSTAKIDQNLIGGSTPMTSWTTTQTVNLTSNSPPSINYTNGTGTVAPLTFSVANPTTFVVKNTALVFIIKAKSGFNP
jgi:microcystin-dependent protein